MAKAVRLLKANREEMEIETGGVSYSLTEDDIKEYIGVDRLNRTISGK